MEQASDAILLIDLATDGILYASPATRELLGLEPEELAGGLLAEYVHRADIDEVLACARRRGSDGVGGSALARMRHRDGRWIWAQIDASGGVVTHDGRLTTVVTVRSASERVRAEIALREARRRLQRIRDELRTVAGTEAIGRLEHDYELTVEALAAALELRDDETGSHARRVTAIALDLARAVDPELAADPELRYAFLLHDIGKIGIPDNVLLKPGRLSDDEMRQLQGHTRLGEQLLASIPFVSDLAHDVIAHHHERWDGTGYPRGLRGTEIPLAARIFAVADAFDAITNDRPYRRAMPLEAAIAEIRSGAGSQFDPAIVDAFVPIARAVASRAG